MTAEHRRWLQPYGADHVGQPRPRPLGAAGAAVGPLIAACLRDEEGAAIATAFEHHATRHRADLRLQLAQRQLERLVDLAVDDELPRIRLRGRLRDLAVVANEEFG